MLAGAVVCLAVGSVAGAAVAHVRDGAPGRVTLRAPRVALIQSGIVADNGYAQFALTFFNYGPGTVRLRRMAVDGHPVPTTRRNIPALTREVVRPQLYCGDIRGNAASNQTPRITVLFTAGDFPPQESEYEMTAVELNLYCPARP